ncbi:MAG: MFS transporter [Chloroflexota bacterium]|nr:MFS transporter [Chloroflexota bacterium]
MNSNNESSRIYVLIAATLAVFVTPFMGSSLNIALPSIGAEFEMDAVLLGWINLAFLMASSTFLVPFGRIADIYGRKRIFTIGILVFTLSSVLCAVSTSGTMLIAARIVQGIGGSMIFGTSVAILTSVFPVGQRGVALGINVAAVYLGLSLGPPIGGLMTQYLGWRSIFIVNVVLGFAVFILVLWRLKGEWAAARGEKFDFWGSLIYGVMIITTMYGFSLLPELSAAWLILVGVAALVAFVWWELRVQSPVLHIDLFRRNVVFAFSNLAALINYSATFAIGFLLSIYLQMVKGFPPQIAGLILIAQPVVMAVVSPVAGRLSDRIEPRVLASAGMGITAVGLAFFIFLDGQTSMVFLIAGLVIVGLGLAIFSSPNTNAVMSSVDYRFLGVASATLATMRQIGMMLSMGIVMMLLALFIGRVQITPEYHDLYVKAMRVAFIVFAVACFGGIFASLARGNVRNNDVIAVPQESND